MNYEIFQAINNLAGHHSLLDQFMVFVTQKALLIFAIILLAMWFFGSEKYKYTVVYAAFTGAIALLINLIIGHIFYEPRPFVTHKVHLLIPHAVDASFPSDHTTGAFALAIAIFLRHRKIGFPIILFAALTGFSRVYVGHHYPFDVLGSIVVGIVVSVIVYKLSPILKPIPSIIINIYNKLPLVPKNKPRDRKKQVRIR